MNDIRDALFLVGKYQDGELEDMVDQVVEHQQCKQGDTIATITHLEDGNVGL